MPMQNVRSYHAAVPHLLDYSSGSFITLGGLTMTMPYLCYLVILFAADNVSIQWQLSVNPVSMHCLSVPYGKQISLAAWQPGSLAGPAVDVAHAGKRAGLDDSLGIGAACMSTLCSCCLV